MCRKLICLVSFVVVLGLVGDVQAAYVKWTGAGPDNLWSTAENWEGGAVPASADEALINVLPGPTVANDGAEVTRVWVSGGRGSSTDAGAVTVDGGTLTMGVSLTLASGASGEGTFNVNSGTVNVTWLKVGNRGSGTLNVTGGTVNATNTLRIPGEGGGTGHVNLDGGIITTSTLKMGDPEGSVATIDVKAGTLIINGDKVSTVQEYIDNGWITAFNGNGRLELGYDVAKGETTLKAIPFLVSPNPVDGSTVSVSLDQLQWTLPEPSLPGGVVTCDVYFGTDGAVTDNPKILNRETVESVSVTLATLTTYYWAIDVYDSSISTTEPSHLSAMFTFDTMNQPPSVDAGADIVTLLQEDVRTGNLDATVIDDGLLNPITVQWTVVSEPNEGAVVIETANAEDTSISLTALGEYVLQLEAFDGESTVSDTVTINVYADSCEAARAMPGYQLLVGDLNGDCRVDDVDLALLQENWLADNSLAEDWILLQ